MLKHHLYDPYGRRYLSTSLKKHYDASFLLESKKYGKNFFDMMGAIHRKYSRQLIAYQLNNIKSQYGYVWRGIKTTYDREMGIAGGELAIVDLKTNEILGLNTWLFFDRDETRWKGLVVGKCYVCPGKHHQLIVL